MPSADPIAALVDRLRQGDTRALARALTLVENDAPEAAAILSACFPHTGRALRIGITGAPGAGKSTLVDRLARAFREAGKTVGVLAVDPTSPFTGGALLGDRIRFQNFTSDAGFYARSMATRGALGGLARATADCALVLEAGGKDVLLLETVGVGQDEVDIARLADVTLLVLVPGMGDDMQSLKAGVMEIADLFVINKADRDGADRVEQEIRTLQSLAPAGNPHRQEDPASGSGHDLSRAEKAQREKGALAPEVPWNPPVVRTIATTGDGVPTLTTALADMEQWLRQNDRLTVRRTSHWQRRLDTMLAAELLRRAHRHGLSESQLAEHAARVAAGHEDPWQLVARLAAKLFHGRNEKEPAER